MVGGVIKMVSQMERSASHFVKMIYDIEHIIYFEERRYRKNIF